MVDESKEVEVQVGGQHDRFDFDKSVRDSLGPDPFARSAEDLRKMDGLSPAFKKAVSREINKRQVGVGAQTKQQTEYSNLSYFKLDVVTPPYNMEYLGKLYEINAAHKAAVDAKVANIVGLGFDFVESHKMRQKIQDLQGTQDKVEAVRRKIDRAKNDLYDWLDSLNEEDTFNETLRRVWTDVETMGNGYLEVGRTVTGEIGYMGHIPGQSIRVRTRRDGFLQMIGNKATFFRNFGDTRTANPIGDDPRPNEIIHFKKYTPNNGYYGVPDIMAAKNALAGTEFASRFNLDYFEHKAVPRYIIIVKGATLSQVSEQRLVEFFQTGLKGTNHRSLYIPLPSDVDGEKAEFEMKPVEAGVQDASFGSYLKFNRDEVLMAHRVPVNKVGLPEGVSLAVARDADKTFKEQVCRPEQRIIEKKLNKIFKSMQDVLNFRLNELTLTDEMEQAKIDEIYLRMQTIVPNEVRRRKGWAGIPKGDSVVELKPQQAAEQRAQAGNSRTRDQQRQSNPSDSGGGTRNAQGAGRSNA